MKKISKDKIYISHRVQNRFCAFFSKNGGSSKGIFNSLNCSLNNIDNKKNVLTNRELVCKIFNFSKKNLILLNQTHSNKVVIINKRNVNKLYNADGMITNNPDVLLGVLTADCAPIAFLGKEFIGIIHAGWKGLVNGIIENTINLFEKNNEKVENLNCFIGPHLSSKYFEVKNDFISCLYKFNKENIKFIEKNKNKNYFNYSGYITSILKSFNIKYIHSNFDTYSNPSLFFSYRFSKQKNKECGRQISVVGIKIRQ